MEHILFWSFVQVLKNPETTRDLDILFFANNFQSV